MQTQKRTLEEVVVLSLRGGLTTGRSVLELRQEIDGVIRQGCRDVVLDLAELEDLDAGGLGALMAMGVFPLLKSLLPVVVAFLLPTTDTLDHRRVGNGTHRHGLFQEPMEELPAMA